MFDLINFAYSLLLISCLTKVVGTPYNHAFTHRYFFLYNNQYFIVSFL